MSAFPIPGGGPPRTRLVGFGLAMVALGWLVLVADLVLAAAGLQAGSLVAALSLKGDIATLAEMLVVTGLGLAIVGALRDGFGALNRFFDTVLQRAVVPRPAPAPEPVPPAADEIVAVRPERTIPERTVPERPAAPAPAAAPGRNYQILPDGSVEVETLLGTRVFASMDEARDFIR